MARPRKCPALHTHPETNRAYVQVTIGSGRNTRRRTLTLGEAGSPEAHREYARVVEAFNDDTIEAYVGIYDNKRRDERRERAKRERIEAPQRKPSTKGDAYLAEIVAAYNDWAKRNMKHETYMGRTRETILRFGEGGTLRKFAAMKASGFDVAQLNLLRDTLLDEPGRGGGGLARDYINGLVRTVQGIMQWGELRGMAPRGTHAHLKALPVLRRGRTNARESRKVRPANLEHIEAAMAHMPPMIADMCWAMIYLAARPKEVRELRGGHIDTSGGDGGWVIRLDEHKTSNTDDGPKVLPVVPQVQAILTRYTLDDPSLPMFTMRRALWDFNRHAAIRASDGVMAAQDMANQIRRACDKAKVPRWQAKQLRHNGITMATQYAGAHTARALAHHAHIDMTSHYANAELADARKASEAIVAALGSG